MEIIPNSVIFSLFTLLNTDRKTCGVALVVRAITALGFAFFIARIVNFLLIFGNYMPKRIAYLRGDNILLKASGLIKFLYYIGLPVSVVLTFIANIFLLVFGICNRGDLALCGHQRSYADGAALFSLEASGVFVELLL